MLGGRPGDGRGLGAEPEQGRAPVSAERELAVTNERYRSLFDYHPDAVFSLTLEGYYDSANAASADLGGYPASALVSMHFTELLAPDEVEKVVPAFERVLAREPQHLETRVRHRDGHLVDISLTAVPIVVGDEVVGVYGVAEDVTERNRMQQELEEARRSAETANEAKSLFLANMSHEIRTPLTSCIAAAELLSDTDLDPQQRRLTELMERSGGRLLRLVDDILDFSRAEAGKATLEVVEIDPREVLDEAIAPARAAARRKGLALEVTVDPSVPQRAVGDPVRIAQVLTNLLDNAVKFTESGTVSLAADGWGDEGRAGLAVVVTDTGIGMSTTQVAQVFDPFSQADASITRRYGGTGLGLAICRQLVELMAGSLEVRSTVGEGTTFTVRLPLGAP